MHRLGPLVRLAPLEGGFVGRLYAVGLAAGAAALLLTAWRLNPNGRQLGTHEQLGLPPCGFAIMTGLPCPTCGMTTAYSYTVRGRFLSAIRAQAGGFVLAIATILTMLISTIAAITGRRPAVNWYRIRPLACVGWATALFVGAWAAKIVLGLLDGSLPLR